MVVPDGERKWTVNRRSWTVNWLTVIRYEPWGEYWIRTMRIFFVVLPWRSVSLASIAGPRWGVWADHWGLKKGRSKISPLRDSSSGPNVHHLYLLNIMWPAFPWGIQQEINCWPQPPRWHPFYYALISFSFIHAHGTHPAVYRFVFYGSDKHYSVLAE